MSNDLVVKYRKKPQESSVEPQLSEPTSQDKMTWRGQVRRLDPHITGLGKGKEEGVISDKTT